MTDYSIFNRAELFSMLKETDATLMAKEAAEAVNSDPVQKKLIISLTTKMTELRAAISKLSTSSNTSQSSQDYKFLQLATTMANAMKDVKKLEPGIPCENFIASLRNNFDLLVKPELGTYPLLEKEFIKQARLRMSETYNTQMSASNVEIKTFEELRTYLERTHGSQLTNYQLLSRAWDLELGQSESLTDFATKLELRMRDAAQQIEARYKADKKSASNPDPQLSAETVFQLIGGMLMSEKIKERSPKIFSHLVRSMDKHYSASNIAHEAKLYEERLGGQADAVLDSDDVAYFLAKSQPKRNFKPKGKKELNKTTTSTNKNKPKPDNKRSQICFKFKKGLPCNKKPCPYRHVTTHTANMNLTSMDPMTSERSHHSSVFHSGLLA